MARLVDLLPKWYNDPQVFWMVKKRVATATATEALGIDHVNGITITGGRKKVKWYENPKILQVLKNMFGPSLYEDGLPDATSFFSRWPEGLEEELLLLKLQEDPDIHQMFNKRRGPHLDEDGKPEGPSFTTRFSKFYEKALQEAWPMLESALKECGISCELDMIFDYVTFKTTRTTDPDIIVKARHLNELLGRGAPVAKAMKVLGESQYDIIKIGMMRDGLCQKFGIEWKEFVERLKLLKGPLEKIGSLVGCDVIFLDQAIAAIGSYQGLKLVRKVVEDCIVHRVHPVCTLNKISCIGRNRNQLVQHFKHLHI